MVWLTDEVRKEDHRTILSPLESGMVAVTMNSGVWNLDFGPFDVVCGCTLMRALPLFAFCFRWHSRGMSSPLVYAAERNANMSLL